MPVRSVCMQTGLIYGFSLLAGPDLVLTSSVAWVTENTHWPAALPLCHNIVRGRILQYPNCTVLYCVVSELKSYTMYTMCVRVCVNVCVCVCTEVM